jgi:hypothetical protein
MVVKATDDRLRCDVAYVLDGRQTDGSSARYNKRRIKMGIGSLQFSAQYQQLRPEARVDPLVVAEYGE